MTRTARVMVNAETNRRAVVTDRAGAFVLHEAAYDAYADRGEAKTKTRN